MGLVEIKQVSIEENVVVIDLPSIVRFENGFYLFNRSGESRIETDVDKVIEDVEFHFDEAKKRLRDVLSKKE